VVVVCNLSSQPQAQKVLEEKRVDAISDALSSAQPIQLGQ
jgi:hypothetical protein